MSSRKRKQQDPPGSTRSAKPSRTATSSTAAARCAKSPSAATAAAASSNYAIRCIRKSKIIEIDEECWTDCNFPDATEELCEDSATAWDGIWLWDSQPNKAACIPFNKACRGFAGGSGKAIVFKTAAEAEAAAVEVWKAMVLATDRPCMPLLEQLQQQQQQRQQAVDASTTAAPKKQQNNKGRTSTACKQQGKGSKQDPGGMLASAAEQLKTVSADGLPAWQVTLQWFDDPFGLPEDERVSNVVQSVVKVAVVEVGLR